MFILELIKRYTYMKRADRLGPDIPFTHWKLHFQNEMIKLCKKKFLHFDDTAQFRPGAYAVCCSKISIGKRVVIRPGSMLFADPRENGAGIIIEDNVVIGSGVHIYVANHRFDNSNIPIIDQGHYPSKKIVLKDGCWIGANTVILPGVTIGTNAVIGAGSVVSRNIAPRTVAVGSPARVIKKIKDSDIQDSDLFLI
jgi:acetyltransferase-like isoleucine patch superfamily enzyme